MGTPSNIDEYTLKRLCTENGAFVCLVTIILLSHLTTNPTWGLPAKHRMFFTVCMKESFWWPCSRGGRPEFRGELGLAWLCPDARFACSNPRTHQKLSYIQLVCLIILFFRIKNWKKGSHGLLWKERFESLLQRRSYVGISARTFSVMRL